MSLYLRSLVSINSFSKSLRSDLKIFLVGCPVFSEISWRVSPFSWVFSVFMTSSSILFRFTILGVSGGLVWYGWEGFSILR